ncbi:hypothetical protein NE237_028614 [Protea cynaroides]|uniref:Uncharacterized protein n=1 Tax=Protea cynaroides TaxID=273540 RepID=A0A9Q0JU93_9MAGN|nr:hypothetical protein NE237_028614 [Protea cynaroides]
MPLRMCPNSNLGQKRIKPGKQRRKEVLRETAALTDGILTVTPIGLVPMEIRPSEIPNPINPSRATVGRWADAEDDDDFRVEDGELQDSEDVFGKRTEAVSGLSISNEASQMATRAFTKVRKCHRGQPVGRANSHVIDASQTSRVNLEDITAAMVGNHNQDV